MGTRMNAQEPRIGPGSRREIGWVNAAIVSVIGRLTGTGTPPNIFPTLARHRRLFRAWLRFAGALMPRGSLPRADTELVIMRVAYNCRCDYEWRQHEPLARAAGLTAEDLERVLDGPGARGWRPRQAMLLRTTDELHETREISDRHWQRLRREFSDEELIELLMLVGHYELLAMTLNALRVEPDKHPARPSALLLGGRRTGLELSGRRVLITGAGRGLGAATARRISRRDARLVLADLDSHQLAGVAADCSDALAVVSDPNDPEQAEAAVEAAVQHLGGLDIVIGTAGATAARNALVAAAPHLSHARGYGLAVLESLGDAIGVGRDPHGARTGVAYVAPTALPEAALGAVERALIRRARVETSPRWMAPLVYVGLLARPGRRPWESAMPASSTAAPTGSFQ
jgi:AhpD family alkylhydroperoxidase